MGEVGIRRARLGGWQLESFLQATRGLCECIAKSLNTPTRAQDYCNNPPPPPPPSPRHQKLPLTRLNAAIQVKVEWSLELLQFVVTYTVLKKEDVVKTIKDVVQKQQRQMQRGDLLYLSHLPKQVVRILQISYALINN